MRSIEKSASTIEEAVKAAIDELKISIDDAVVEVLDKPNKGFFGIGSKMAKVKVTVAEKKIEKPVIREHITRKVTELTTEERETAQKFLREVLNAMDIKAEIKIKLQNDSMYINLAGPKMGIIIGRRGQTLDSLQYLVSLVVNKNKDKEQYIKVILDTEDYRKKREETLDRLATRLADKVIKTGKKVDLEPMNPYERRIIHAALQSYPEITTFSEGEEPNRKVVIALKTK